MPEGPWSSAATSEVPPPPLCVRVPLSCLYPAGERLFACPFVGGAVTPAKSNALA